MRRSAFIVFVIILLLAGSSLAGDKYVKAPLKGKFTLEQLYSHPHIWGTEPSQVKWDRGSQQVAFLWNQEGGRFRDLWLVNIPEGKLIRLTRMKDFPPIPLQEDKRTEEEKWDAERLDNGVGYFDWSPKGDELVLTYRGDIFLVKVEKGVAPKRIVQSLEGESRPQFSPDGEVITFIKGGNLWAYAKKEGIISQLTTLSKRGVSIGQYSWAPDGSCIFLATMDASMHREINIPDYTRKYTTVSRRRRGYVGDPLPITRLGRIAREGGLIQWIDFGEEVFFLRGFQWSPDGKQLLINHMGKDYQDWRIYLIDPQTLEKKEVYHEHQEPWFWSIDAFWSPDGKTLFLTSEKDGWRHIYSLPAGGGELSQMTKGEWDVLFLTVPEKRENLFFTSNALHPLERHLYSLNLKGGTPVRLTSFKGHYTPFVSSDGRWSVVSFSQVPTPPDLYLLTNREQERKMQKRLTHSPRPEFEKVQACQPRYFTFTSEADGKTIHARMLLPKNFSQSKRYPVVISCVYADRAKNSWSRYHLLDFYMVNELNYIVVNVDNRASIGYGKDFHYGYYQQMGIVDAEELVSAANYLKKLTYIDPQRIGIWGGSYGGFLTLMVMCNHPGVFHTGVAWKPVTDWHNYFDSYTAQRLGRPQENEEVYRQTSPVYQAAGLQGNLLLVHGMQDVNVLFQDTAQMVQRLIEAGKYFDLMIYPRDNHMLSLRDESLPDLMKRIARYFEDHMRVGPE